MLNNSLNIQNKRRKYKFEINSLEKLKGILVMIEGGKGSLIMTFYSQRIQMKMILKLY